MSAPTLLHNATAIGWTPRDLWAATMSEYREALAGWNRSQGKPVPLKRDEVDAVRARVAAHKRRKAEKRAHG